MKSCITLYNLSIKMHDSFSWIISFFIYWKPIIKMKYHLLPNYTLCSGNHSTHLLVKNSKWFLRENFFKYEVGIHQTSKLGSYNETTIDLIFILLLFIIIYFYFNLVFYLAMRRCALLDLSPRSVKKLQSHHQLTSLQHHSCSHVVWRSGMDPKIFNWWLNYMWISNPTILSSCQTYLFFPFSFLCNFFPFSSFVSQ